MAPIVLLIFLLGPGPLVPRAGPRRPAPCTSPRAPHGALQREKAKCRGLLGLGSWGLWAWGFGILGVGIPGVLGGIRSFGLRSWAFGLPAFSYLHRALCSMSSGRKGLGAAERSRLSSLFISNIRRHDVTTRHPKPQNPAPLVLLRAGLRSKCIYKTLPATIE